MSVRYASASVDDEEMAHSNSNETTSLAGTSSFHHGRMHMSLSPTQQFQESGSGRFSPAASSSPELGKRPSSTQKEGVARVVHYDDADQSETPVDGMLTPSGSSEMQMLRTSSGILKLPPALLSPSGSGSVFGAAASRSPARSPNGSFAKSPNDSSATHPLEDEDHANQSFDSALPPAKKAYVLTSPNGRKQGLARNGSGTSIGAGSCSSSTTRSGTRRARGIKLESAGTELIELPPLLTVPAGASSRQSDTSAVAAGESGLVFPSCSPQEGASGSYSPSATGVRAAADVAMTVSGDPTSTTLTTPSTSASSNVMPPLAPPPPGELASRHSSDLTPKNLQAASSAAVRVQPSAASLKRAPRTSAARSRQKMHCTEMVLVTASLTVAFLLIIVFVLVFVVPTPADKKPSSFIEFLKNWNFAIFGVGFAAIFAMLFYGMWLRRKRLTHKEHLNDHVQQNDAVSIVTGSSNDRRSVTGSDPGNHSPTVRSRRRGQSTVDNSSITSGGASVSTHNTRGGGERRVPSIPLAPRSATSDTHRSPPLSPNPYQSPR